MSTCRARIAVLASVVVLMSACDSAADRPDTQPLPAGESLTELRRQAQAVLARYAADPSASTPAWDSTNPPAGVPISSVTSTGSRLTVSFTGARGPATEPCGVDYSAEVAESEQAVVVIVISQPHAEGEICPAVGAPRSASVNLERPLGPRVVLDIRDGQPVPTARG